MKSRNQPTSIAMDSGSTSEINVPTPAFYLWTATPTP